MRGYAARVTPLGSHKLGSLGPGELFRRRQGNTELLAVRDRPQRQGAHRASCPAKFPVEAGDVDFERSFGNP
jgi:hypothetical protein